jgi:potassium efflux system protein
MEDVLSQSEKDIESKHPIIQKFTLENIQYSRDLQTMTAKIEQISDQKTQVEIKTADIENEFKSADKKISLASLSPALGKILREQRRNLAHLNEKQEGRKLQNETELTSLEQFKIEDKQKSLLNLDATLKQLMATEVETTLPFEQRMMIQAELRVLLNNQKELLNKLALADATYLRTLGDLDFTRQQMLVQANKFAEYLDERLLWVQSSEPVNLAMLTELYHSVQWLFSRSNWLELGSETSRAIQNNRLFFSMSIAFLWLLMRLKSWTRQHLQVTETELHHWHTAHFYSTLQAFFYQILFTLPIPIIVYLFGIFLTKNSSTDFTLALGTGLQKSSITLFMGQFSYAIFAVDGIVRRHFQWQKNTVLLLHTHFGWLRFVIVPAVFLIHATHTSKFSEHSDSLGRIALIVALIAFTVFMVKLLRHDLWRIRLKNHAPRLCYVAFALVITIPLTVISAAIMGYYSSALELQEKLIITLRLLIFVVVIHEMVLRWLTLVNRQLALKNAEQQRELHDKYDEELPLDIPKINAQTKKLLHVTLAFAMILGVGLIWKNLLPAFSFLDQIVLWQHKILVENQESYQPITLTNLLFAGLYFFIAVVAVRNFYGLLELLVFRRWEIEVGSRYATNQLAKYFFITVAFISISNELGGSWSQVQWLVAALGVGLGFGLQEIFANLVSGIILLFERPIRVGDVVTIGDVTGSVCRIQMRATTLIDIDQRELIVPNKTFITSQLTNWTLSNTTTRIVLPIGIDFNSNVEFAHALMLQTVKDSALVLDTPEPCVLFIGFGESALNFSICAFVKEPTTRWFVIHDLNMRLEKTLRENKIKIPYPQRDVHVLS